MTSANKSRFVLIIMGILMVILSPIVAKYICDNLLAGGDGDNNYICFLQICP